MELGEGHRIPAPCAHLKVRNFYKEVNEVGRGAFHGPRRRYSDPVASRARRPLDRNYDSQKALTLNISGAYPIIKRLKLPSLE